MSNENITLEIKEYADVCRQIASRIYKECILAGDYDEQTVESMERALSQYRQCLEIMKLEKEL